MFSGSYFYFYISNDNKNEINKGDMLSLENNLINGNENIKNSIDLKFSKYQLLKKWTIHEKDSLKKYLFTFCL